MFLLLCTTVSVCFSADSAEVKKEILLRIPLLSPKSTRILSNSIDSLKGIMEIEACYELRVFIITFDANKISDEATIMNILNKQDINTTIEKINSSDIPVIKKNYKISKIKPIDNKTQ